MPSAVAMPSLLDDGAFLEELEKLETGTPRPQPVSRPPFWGGAAPVSNAKPVARQAVPAGAEATPAAQDGAEIAADAPGNAHMGHDAFVWPETVDAPSLTGEHAYYEDGEQVTAPRQRGSVSSRLAALVIVVGVIAGAGSAAMVFHDRVDRIVTAWTVVAR
jgi:hypothetical protein